jgi:hypothetical protein
MDNLLKPRHLKIIGLLIGLAAVVFAIGALSESRNASHTTNPESAVAMAIVALAFVRASEQPLPK